MLDHVLLWVNGRCHDVRGPDAFLSLSDFLRRRLGLPGTKIVCSEGDCGACTVLIGRLAADGSRLVYRPVDSCIQFMFQLDGTHIVTIEGLGTETTPSAVQQAMIDCHGSQCGFCTPGFVVAMTALLEECEGLDEACLRRGLTGNLCRCTGYTPIIEAGCRVSGVGGPDSDNGKPPRQRFEELYLSGEMVRDFAARRREPIELRAEWNGERHLLFSPVDLNGALTLLQQNPDATIIAGATDIGVRFNKSSILPAKILDLNRLAELETASIENGEMVLGARTSWSTLEAMCQPLVPEFYRIISLFGAPQIRHVGTIVGNIANASPIADSLPFLYVMEAVLELHSASARRVVNINDFYQGYKKLDLRAGELITKVRIPLPRDDELLRLYKVSRRRDLDIASFTAAIRMRMDGETISNASIAFGAVGPTVIRARRTEEFLRGRLLDEDIMEQAGDVAITEVSPISDVRGAADYRYQLTRNILLKFYHETQASAVTVI